MNAFSIENLQLEEIKLLRQSLNVIQITGASAQFVANLQNKLAQVMSHQQAQAQAQPQASKCESCSI